VEIISDFVDKNAVVTVRDTGMGIKEEELKYIFDEYSQLSGRSIVPGTGLGMAISKQFVELHGGKIWVESKFGEGSVFHFSIPIKG
jgi:signal transduction histidine kinase